MSYSRTLSHKDIDSSIMRSPLKKKNTASTSTKMMDGGVFYVGMPLARDDTTPIICAVAVEPKQRNAYNSAGYGLLAFIVGAVLACFAWIFNQFCSIASLLVLGEFTWTFESAWKHVLVSGLGSMLTAIAFWAGFKMIFPTLLNDHDDEDDGPSSHKRDISDALQDLGELGFMAGFCGAQTFFVKLVCNNLDELGITCEQSSTALNGLTLIFVISWMLCAKMRDYIKAVNRMAKYDGRSSEVAHEIYQSV
jgi:hypothetical protein